MAPPAALFTAATHGFFTVLYRRSVSGEKVAILSFTGCATAAIGTQASSAATTIFRISLTSLGFMFHRPFRDVAAAREPDAFVLLRVLQHLSRDRDQRRPRTHVRVPRELAPLGTAGLALRVELVEGRLPVLPHELRRRARRRPHPEVVVRQVDARQDDHRAVLRLLQERDVVAHVIAAPEITLLLQQLERVPRHRAALAHPAN